MCRLRRQRPVCSPAKHDGSGPLAWSEWIATPNGTALPAATAPFSLRVKVTVVTPPVSLPSALTPAVPPSICASRTGAVAGFALAGPLHQLVGTILGVTWSFGIGARHGAGIAVAAGQQPICAPSMFFLPALAPTLSLAKRTVALMSLSLVIVVGTTGRA